MTSLPTGAGFKPGRLDCPRPAFDDLPVGDPTVSSVDVRCKTGHPGIEKPHVHDLLFHGTDAKARLAK